jgi:predicted outer membrane protein
MRSVATLITALLLGATPAAAHAQAPATSPTDLDFVRRVHLTVLSVRPASALAKNVSAHAAVKTLAAQVTSQYNELDTLARSTATAVRVSLTSPLPAPQQSALATLESHTGSVFDTELVNYLWTADSTLLPIAMTVHGTTRNTTVRRLADRADTLVAAQLPLLQKSGLLQMSMLPAPSPAATVRLPGGVPPNQSLEAQSRSGAGYLAPGLPVRVLVLVAAVGAAGALTWRLLTRSSSARRGRRRARPGTTETPVNRSV